MTYLLFLPLSKNSLTKSLLTKTVNGINLARRKSLWCEKRFLSVLRNGCRRVYKCLMKCTGENDIVGRFPENTVSQEIGITIMLAGVKNWKFITSSVDRTFDKKKKNPDRIDRYINKEKIITMITTKHELVDKWKIMKNLLVSNGVRKFLNFICLT